MAWMTWMLVHIFFLIGFRNRYSVFLSWAFTYITEQDGVRLIVGSQNLPGWELLAEKDSPVADKPSVSPWHA
jgi:NADH dehydrogenase